MLGSMRRFASLFAGEILLHGLREKPLQVIGDRALLQAAYFCVWLFGQKERAHIELQGVRKFRQRLFARPAAAALDVVHHLHGDAGGFGEPFLGKRALFAGFLYVVRKPFLQEFGGHFPYFKQVVLRYTVA